MSEPAIRVLGWYGHSNSGDEAFRDVHRTIAPHIDWRWLSPAKLQAAPAGPPGERVIVLSAGDIVQDFYTAHLPPDVPVIAYGVGLAGHLQVAVLQALGDRLRGVWVRNETDLPMLLEAGLPARATPDIVFCLHGHLPANRRLLGKPRKRAVVVVSDNVRADVLRANDTRRFVAFQHFLDELAESVAYLADWYQVVLVPFSFDHNDYDLAAIFDLRPRLRARDQLLIVEERMPPLEMMALFATADLVVTQKFHGAIYAMLHGTPFLAISDARKVGSLCAENGLDPLHLPMRNFSAEEFKRRLPVAEGMAGAVAAARDVAVPRAREEAGRFLAMLHENLAIDG